MRCFFSSTLAAKLVFSSLPAVGCGDDSSAVNASMQCLPMEHTP